MTVARYFVHSLKRGRLVEARGPYTARRARQYARIAASKGRHNRAVTRGRRITRIYQRGTGANLYVGFDPGAALMFLSMLHAERRVPPGYERSKKGRGLHGEPATLYLYPNKDVYVLPDDSSLSGYRVPGGSKELDVSGGKPWVSLTLWMRGPEGWTPFDQTKPAQLSRKDVVRVTWNLRKQWDNYSDPITVHEYRDGAWKRVATQEGPFKRVALE